jgi:Polyketide cyclase / dehydrase and lipid transport
MAEDGSDKIEYGAVLPVDPDRAFGFVSDPTNWPRFFASMRSAEAGPDWGRVGGHGRMVTSFLGRDVVSEFELTTWDPPREFRYVARQRGRPDLDNRRIFLATEGGTRLAGTTRLRPRPGLAGLTDRISLRALQGIYRKAMLRLPEVVRQATAPPR